ncbi:hypothetical protein KAT67_01425 [candidate division WOR-3 bacterium]|jgi:hypothetical protein|nr:hypothetical protein [candidate division WOR-3 bacterium]
MNRLLIFPLIIICFANAIEYSHRIQALGTDFAGLIPDYETDLYQNPQLFGERLVGISYDAYSSEPLKLILLSKRFGMYAKYWGSYSYEQTATDYGWESFKTYSFHFEDLWMLDMRNRVWNLYNDGFFSKTEYLNSYNFSSQNKTLEYFLKGQGSYNIGNFLKLNITAGGGIYWRNKKENDFNIILDQWIIMPSGRIGIFYRNAPLPNKFSSWFIDIGGPISTYEIGTLPYSIYLHVSEVPLEVKQIFFANTIIGRIGWAKGLPINDEGFVAIGWRDDFLYQQTEQADTNITFCGIRNTLSLPLAVEYRVNKFTIRFGTRVYYSYTYNKEWDNNTILKQQIRHAINYNYSFGLGWQPSDNFVIDLGYKRSYYGFDIGDWSIYLKYLF